MLIIIELLQTKLYRISLTSYKKKVGTKIELKRKKISPTKNTPSFFHIKSPKKNLT